MGKTLYLECNMGISGDMTVAALLDLGAEERVLRQALDSMPLSGFEIEISRVKKAGLDVCDFHVKLDKEHENHDHDMEYLHGHDHPHNHGQSANYQEHMHGHDQSQGTNHQEHMHEHDQSKSADYQEHMHEHDQSQGTNHQEHMHEHDQNQSADYHEDTYQHDQSQGTNHHEHIHEHDHSTDHHQHGHHHSHEHRGLPEIQNIIRCTDMSEKAKATALRIFEILAHGEAKAHGVDIADVHFHEVGAVDSIADIVAAAVCLDNLNVTEVIVPYLCEGRGTVRCQHGILPIPVPAVANIVQMNHLSLQLTEIYGELVTPTGAAIVAAIKNRGELPERFTIEKIGMGSGKRNYERPSILRAMLIQPETKHEERHEAKHEERHEVKPETKHEERHTAETEENVIYKLETNIDDCTGEMLGYVMECLFENGAADVNYTPVFMKKNRPAYLLTVLCAEESVAILESIIFRETTTIGIRKVKMERSILERELETLHLSVGEIKVKRCVLQDGTIRRYPEYETVAGLARETGRSMQEILDIYHKEQ